MKADVAGLTEVKHLVKYQLATISEGLDGVYWLENDGHPDPCVITQNGESSHDLLLSVTNTKALAPGGTAPQSPL